jgi:hypothetical protein
LVALLPEADNNEDYPSSGTVAPLIAHDRQSIFDTEEEKWVLADPGSLFIEIVGIGFQHPIEVVEPVVLKQLHALKSWWPTPPM